jgi:hypothetical protein
MPQDGRPRHGSISGAIFLIGLGVFLLVMRMYPEVDFWPLLMRYWPLILIFVGLGKILDSLMARREPGYAGERWFSGVSVAILVLVALFAAAVLSGRAERYEEQHEFRSVGLENAKTVNATIEMPAGTLDLGGGTQQLLDADFIFNKGRGTPEVQYSVDNGEGSLHVSHEETHHIHFSTTHDTWRLRLNNEVPLDLKINMGAGQCNLRLNGMNESRLDLNMGAGELDADFTGKRKTDLDVYINGGVGEARIHLPKDIGVEVRATGGIGSVSSGGLRHDGDEYVNDLYGKSPVTIRVTIKGGVGNIELYQEP